MGENRPSGPVVQRVPAGDNKPRLVCDDCGFVHYVNPRVVVGALCRWDSLILLCRRAVEPRAGFWTLPAGFLEVDETPVAGAAREVWEEARAHITIDGLLGVYSIPRIHQVQLIYRAKLTTPEVAPGEETQEVRMFAWNAIPWEDLAFPSVHWALRHYREVGERAEFAPRSNPEGQTGDLMPGADRPWFAP